MTGELSRPEGQEDVVDEKDGHDENGSLSNVISR